MIGNLYISIKVGEYMLYRTEDIVEVEVEPLDTQNKTVVRINFDDNSFIQTVVKGIMQPPKDMPLSDSSESSGGS